MGLILVIAFFVGLYMVVHYGYKFLTESFIPYYAYGPRKPKIVATDPLDDGSVYVPDGFSARRVVVTQTLDDGSVYDRTI